MNTIEMIFTVIGQYIQGSHPQLNQSNWRGLRRGWDGVARMVGGWLEIDESLWGMGRSNCVKGVERHLSSIHFRMEFMFFVSCGFLFI